MSENRHKYDDFFRKKLANFESPVSDNLFERLMSDRSMSSQLENFESVVSENLFDKLMRDRESSDEMPSDAITRERLLAHQTPVSEQTFNHIMAEREQHRRVLVKRSALVFTLVFVAYAMFIKHELVIDPTKGKEMNKSNDITYKNETIINNKERKKNDKVNKNELIINNKETITGDKKINKNKFIVNNNKKDDNYKTNSPFTTNLIAIATMAYPTSIASNSTNYSTEHAASQQAIIPTTLSTISPEAAVSVNMSKLLTDNTHKIDIQNSEPTNFNPLSITLDAPLEPQHTSIRSYTEGGVFAAQSPVLTFENLAIFKVKNIPLPLRDLKNPCTSSDPGDGCPSFSKRNRRHGDRGEKAVYVDIYGAPEYAFRRLSQNLPESTSYLSARDTVEKPWYAFSAGARASVVFGNGVALRTGFVYAQNNEIATFDSLGIGEKKLIETYLPRSGGGQDTIYKTEITSGIFRMKHYNRYRSFDLPLQLGFELPMSDYWVFSVNGGVNFNISSWRKVTILNEKLAREDVSSTIGELNPVFRNTFGLSIFGSVAAYRQLSGNVQLVIEPSIRHYLQPITRSNYALNQSYTNLGLIVGLRFGL